MIIRRFLGGLVLAALMVGCASGPLYVQPDPAPDGYATVVFMRPPGYVGAAWPLPFYVDKRVVGKLRVNGYMYTFVRAGVHDLHSGMTADFKGLLVTVDLQPGRTYYYLSSRELTGVMNTPTPVATSEASAVMLTKEQAEAAIKTYKLAEAAVPRID